VANSLDAASARQECSSFLLMILMPARGFLPLEVALKPGVGRDQEPNYLANQAVALDWPF